MQRSRVRRKPITAAQGRVADLNDAAQFEKLSKKYSDRLIVLVAYTTWHGGCKELRELFKHVSSKAQYSHVVFLEADCEKDSVRPVTDFVDPTSIPNVSFFWRGQMIEDIKGATPATAYHALMRHEKSIGAGNNGHAESGVRGRRHRWRLAAKVAGAGLSIVAAGLLGYKLWTRRDSESGLVQKIDRVNQKIKAARQGLGGEVKRRKRRRRGSAPKSSVATSDLADLHEKKQALERRLDEIRRKTAGPVSRSSSDPQVQAYTAGASDVDDSSSEEDED